MKTNGIKSKKELIAKAKKEWGEDWDEGMIEYIPDENIYMVWVGGFPVYKAWFDANTLECLGTKC